MMLERLWRVWIAWECNEDPSEVFEQRIRSDSGCCGE